MFAASLKSSIKLIALVILAGGALPLLAIARCNGEEKEPDGVSRVSSPAASKPEDQGNPLVRHVGDFGRVEVWLFDRGVAVSGKDKAASVARQLVTALEKAIRDTQAKDEPSHDAGHYPSREKILRSGWVLELRYELPVKQSKLGFISPDYSRLFSLNRFLIPITGEYAHVDAADQKSARLFPYEAIRTSDKKLVLRDWCADHRSVVFSTVDLGEVHRALTQLGVKVDR
jgi:hypothetical protein